MRISRNKPSIASKIILRFGSAAARRFSRSFSLAVSAASRAVASASFALKPVKFSLAFLPPLLRTGFFPRPVRGLFPYLGASVSCSVDTTSSSAAAAAAVSKIVHCFSLFGRRAVARRTAYRLIYHSQSHCASAASISAFAASASAFRALASSCRSCRASSPARPASAAPAWPAAVLLPLLRLMACRSSSVRPTRAGVPFQAFRDLVGIRPSLRLGDKIARQSCRLRNGLHGMPSCPLRFPAAASNRSARR